MRVVLDKKTAEQIAEEAAILRANVIKAAEKYEIDHAGYSRYLLNQVRRNEEEFLRALYIIGVVGVKWIDTNDQRYAFVLDEALEALERREVRG